MVGGQLVRGLFAGAVVALVLSAGPMAAPALSPVADAAERGDIDAVRTLLTQGGDVNAAQGDGMTALHWAARRGDVTLAQMLLYAGANVRATTRLGGYTPLVMASQLGHASMVARLLESGADPRIATTNGTTPLMVAAASGSAGAVKALLDHGADVNAKESARGETALMFATAFNRVDAMRLLIDRGADVKATTKVVDLSTQTSPEEEAFLRLQQQGQGGAFGGRGQAAAGAPGGGPFGALGGVAGASRQFRFSELVGTQGGLTPLLFAARQGHDEAVKVLLEAGADINQVGAGDKTSPLLMATINGHLDLARFLLASGADPRLASANGVTPLYAALNVQWAPKALYPQPRAHLQQQTTHLELMGALLDKGADPNARLSKKVWYSGYNFDLAGVDEIGATPFWRAAYAGDVDAMRLLVTHGADPNIRTIKPAGRPRTGDGDRGTTQDVSGLPPVPVGGPSVGPLQAAAGVGYGEGFAANSHNYVPAGPMPAVRYLVEELGADVNAVDHEGNTALHHAAARGDNEMILYLVSKGADVTIVNREGQTTADMANGPVQRIQPFPETVALLMRLGSKNSNKCVSC